MASQSFDASALAETLENLVHDIDKKPFSLKDEDRYKLSEAARKLSWTLEAPGDTPLQLPLATIGVETRIFEILSEIGGTATNAELAKKANVDPAMLKRLLRYYQSFGFISQPSNDAYSANNVTKAMASPGARVACPVHLEKFVPIYNAIPEFLREAEYSNSADINNCPLNLVHSKDGTFWSWLGKDLPQRERFTTWTQCFRYGLPTIFDAFDIKDEIGQNSTDSTILFVDVAGASGHQCVAFKQRYPELPGRIILQDRPEVIQQVKSSPLPGFERIEAQPHDIFKPQPIIGARAYYLRAILHNWPDDKCIEILQNIKAGMTEESKILIDDMVLPERGAHWRATQFDFIMYSYFGAMERSRAQWEVLLDKAGLQILKASEYTKQLNEALIVAVPK
ncbi:S-adenosyl-L-methionine-dependent methyltransferase [Annulohypoxylon truncatum]|uniref:S-adenosyl-L-methionine-dependent methyltransferase n=1 Tax=Annulohypoxylon truncatum TaxID=327061 RepID=UPI0020086F3D|nr:S-adenosyl-L-methionine-dependent methyltransferase [Annulohypoxylon truncatum]KAI1208247.1 S-adenosyl-L-methionine-dependent methyltransferase [Annulohypoxylon truncatum]